MNTYIVTHNERVVMIDARDARDASFEYAHRYDVDGYEIEINSRDRVTLHCDDGTIVIIEREVLVS